MLVRSSGPPTGRVPRSCRVLLCPLPPVVLDDWLGCRRGCPGVLAVRFSLQDRVFAPGHCGCSRSPCSSSPRASASSWGSSQLPTLQHYGLSFFTEYRWLPSQGHRRHRSGGAGTLQVAFIAPLLKFPLSLLTALFITDWAPAWAARLLVRAVDLMAAIAGHRVRPVGAHRRPAARHARDALDQQVLPDPVLPRPHRRPDLPDLGTRRWAARRTPAAAIAALAPWR